MVVRFGRGPELGWLVAAVGVGLEVVGWYQVSGQPTEAQQLPYLASATIPGAALIVAGAVLIAAAGRGSASRRGIREGGTASGAVRGPGLWALPDGTYLHRGDCPLLDGKPDAYVVGVRGVGAEAVAGTDAAGTPAGTPMRACPICEPDLAPVR